MTGVCHRTTTTALYRRAGHFGYLFSIVVHNFDGLAHKPRVSNGRCTVYLLVNAQSIVTIEVSALFRGANVR